MSQDTVEQIVVPACTISMEVSYLAEEEKAGKHPNEFCALRPLELESENKAEFAAGCWLESDMKKNEEGRGKKMGRKSEACGLG